MKSLKLIIALTLIWNMSAAQVNEGTVPDATEYQVLKDIYNTMGGTSWTTKTNWPTTWPATVTNQEFGTWHGVVVTDGDIMGIYLGANNVSGPIPASIGQLAKIRVIFLENNHVSGSIPESIGNLSVLWKLLLNINQITGSIPATINNCSLLNEVWLNNNQLSGPVPSLGNLNALQILNLGDNQLSGTLPGNFFSAFQWVHTLRLGNNSGLTGALPDLSPMIRLQQLDLVGNQFTGSLPANITSPALIYLLLAGNQFSGTIPNSYGSLPNIFYINLSNNQLTGPIPSSLGNLSTLKWLFLRNNQLTGTIPSSFSSLALTRVYFNNNQLTGDAGVFASMPGLEEAHLNNNQFTGISGFATATNKPAIHLAVQENQLTLEDIAPLYPGGISGFTALSVAPQSLVDEEKTIQGLIGGSITLIATVDRSVNPLCEYQWFKKVGSTVTALNSASTSGHTVTVSGITESDEGTKYYYTIARPGVPLTLTSKEQTLDAIVCSSATVDFTSEELNGTHVFNPAFTAGGCTPTFTWDFGDGTTSTEQAATHAYSSTGTYTVLLTVNYTCGPCPAGQLTVQHEVVIENSFCGSIYCDGAGGVGIGTQVTEGFRLSVNGKIRASDIIKVYPQGQWSDFVFEKDYKLRPLSEVERFIKTNGHLPEIPSAKEVEKEGIDLGGMDAKLLQKIEELTLYMIELKKENEVMKKQIQAIEQSSKKTK